MSGATAEDRQLGPTKGQLSGWLVDQVEQSQLVDHAAQLDQAAADGISQVDGALAQSDEVAASLDGAIATQQQRVAGTAPAVQAIASAGEGAQTVATAAASAVDGADQAIGLFDPYAGLAGVGGMVADFQQKAGQSVAPLDPAGLQAIADGFATSLADAQQCAVDAQSGLDELVATRSGVDEGRASLEQLGASITDSAQPGENSAIAAKAVAAAATSGTGAADPQAELREWAAKTGQAAVDGYKARHTPDFDGVYVPSAPDEEIDLLRGVGRDLEHQGISPSDREIGEEAMGVLTPLEGTKGIPQARAAYGEVDLLVPEIERMAPFAG